LFIYTTKLVDITEVLYQSGIEEPKDGDHITGMYESDEKVPHFLYYQKKE